VGPAGPAGPAGVRGVAGPQGPAGPPGATTNLRAFDASGETASCTPEERLVSAICRGSGTPVMEGSTVRCAGATGVVGLCMRR
jgi:hypothetical protein